jgi:glycosyltransferase involved in cell wall biosynthesis
MSERPTIAYLTSEYGRASDTFIRGEVEQLRRLGYRVHTFSVRKPGASELVSEEIRREHAQTVFLLEAGPLRLALATLRAAVAAPGRFFEAVRTVIRTVPPGIPRRWVRRVSYLLEAAYLAEWLAAKDVRHLHNHIGENSAVVAMLAARFREIPYSLTIHGPGEFDRPTLLALGEKIRGAAFVAAISEFTRSQLYRWSDPEDWPKIHVVHCGLDEAEWLVDAEPVPSRPRLVSVGRLSEQKGQWLLVEAAARLRAQGVDFELVLVGDGPLRPELERRVERLGLPGQVRMTGYLSSADVRRELLAARVLVQPSFAEGLPVVIMEALALCRPVISTFVAGIPELVEPGITGWLVPAGAVEPLAGAMAEALAADPAELDRMGHAGADRVARDHNAATEAGKLARLIAGASAGAIAGPFAPRGTPHLLESRGASS